MTKKYLIGLLSLAAMVGVVGCEPAPETGRATVRVALDGSNPADITRVEVFVTGPGIAPAISVELTRTSGQWHGVISGIPAGAERRFTATAYDSAGTAHYQGTAEHVTILPRRSAFVGILAQELNPPDPFDNDAPTVDALYADSSQAGHGEQIAVRAEASDANAGDTLTYAWTATAGAFDDASALNAIWTAPATDGAVTLTFTVRDQDGAEATASFVMDVQQAFGNGTAEVEVSFNTWPRIDRVVVSPNPVLSGQATQVTVVATDADGDWFAYAWSADCAGTFGAQAMNTTFTPSGPDGDCTARVIVTDGRGGSMSGDLTFRVGPQTGVNFPPVVTGFTPAEAISPSQTVALFVEATEANGSPLSFTWVATAGSLSAPVSVAARSDVSWTAPACLPVGQAAIVVATVLDQDGQETSQAFNFGLPTCAAATTEALVPSTGGTITTSSGARMIIPAGALDQPTNISIVETGTVAPAEYGGASQLYEFGPAGTVFAKPVPIRFPMPTGMTDGAIYWSTIDGSGYEAIGGQIEGNEIVGEVVHFSSGFVGAAASSRSVTGSRVITWLSSSAVFNEAVDLTSTPIEALVPDADGGYAVITGAGTMNGTFSIPNVPEGGYLLRVGNLYTWTDNDVIDLGALRLGRPDVSLAPAGTALEFNVTNLAPWEEGDSMEMFSTEVDYWWFQMELEPSNVNFPSVGATELAGMTVDYLMQNGSLSGARLIEGSKGDQLTLAQLETRVTETGHQYLAMSRVFEPAPFDVVPGATTVVTGAFTDVAAEYTLSLDVRSEEFQALVPGFGANVLPYPDKTYWGFSLAVLGQPGGLTNGVYGATADFVAMIEDYNLPNFQTGTMSYGMPLTGLWGAYGDVRFTYYKRFLLPGTAGAATMSVGSSFYKSLEDFEADPVRPQLSSVQNAAVEGQSLFAPATVTTTMPVVSWTEPAIGTPTGYAVSVQELYIDGSNRTRRRVLYSVNTTEQSVRLPPNTLVPGGTYFVVVSAISDAYPDQDRAPYRNAMPGARGTFISEVITVAP